MRNTTLRRAVILLCLLPLCAFPSVTLAQDTQSPPSERGDLILHRVYLSEAELETGGNGAGENESGGTEAGDTSAALESAIPPLYRNAPEILYRLITSSQPVVRVENPENAHSTISTRLRARGNTATGGPGRAGSEGSEGSKANGSVGLTFTLSGKAGEPLTFERELPVPPSHDEYEAVLGEAVELFTPELGRVEPEVKISAIETDEETEELLDEIMFQESTAAPFETGLWIGIASKGISGDEDANIEFVFPTHYVAEFSWFPSKNHGITGNLLFAVNDFFTLGEVPASDGDDAASRNTLIFPGAGYTYRTLGRLSGGFFFGYSAGFVRIEALEPLQLYESDTILQEGDTQGYFSQFITMRPFISYSINAKWSVKTSMVFFLEPSMFVDEGPAYVSDLQTLNLCISYRWGR